MTFDIKKFLIENTLTTKSKFARTSEEIEETLPGEEEGSMEDAPEGMDDTLALSTDPALEPTPEDLEDPMYGMEGEREDSKYDGYVQADWGGDPDMYENIEKYFGYNTAEEIIREMDKDIQKVIMETKLAKIKEIMTALEGKINVLEEDENFKDYINPTKVKQLRRVNKGLRQIEEKLTKEYSKKYLK